MKKNSKAIMLMLVSIMAMTILAGCKEKKDATPEIVGTWKVATVETAGVSVDFDEYAKQLGQDADSLTMEITAKEDKTISMDFMGNKAEGTWEEKAGEYTLELSGQKQKVEIKDGKLTFTEESMGVTMTLEKK